MLKRLLQMSLALPMSSARLVRVMMRMRKIALMAAPLVIHGIIHEQRPPLPCRQHRLLPSAAGDTDVAFRRYCCALRLP